MEFEVLILSLSVPLIRVMNFVREQVRLLRLITAQIYAAISVEESRAGGNAVAAAVVVCMLLLGAARSIAAKISIVDRPTD